MGLIPRCLRRNSEAFLINTPPLGAGLLILEQMPEHAEALLLKAQILQEGFADLKGAKQCLRQIMRLDLPPESTARQWAKGMLEEVTLRLREEKEREASRLTAAPPEK